MLIGLLSRAAVIIPVLVSLPAEASTLASWDFNRYDGDARRIEPAHGSGTLVLGEDWTESSLSNPGGSTLNTDDTTGSGKALSMSGMIRNGKFFEVFLPVEDCADPKVTAAIRRSATGFSTVRLSVSVDGGQSFQEGPSWSIGETWAIHSATLAAQLESSQLILRFEVDGAASSRGTILLDNLEIRCGKKQTKQLTDRSG